MTDWRPDPMPAIDEDTVRREKAAADERVKAVATGSERTQQAITFFDGLVATARSLYEENDYTARMLGFMRGSNRAAS